jgi:hypothetical protein
MPDLVSTVEYSCPPSTATLPYTDRRTTLLLCKIQSFTICLLARMPLLQAGLKLPLAHFCNNLHISILCYTALPRRPVSSN